MINFDQHYPGQNFGIPGSSATGNSTELPWHETGHRISSIWVQKSSRHFFTHTVWFYGVWRENIARTELRRSNSTCHGRSNSTRHGSYAELAGFTHNPKQTLKG